MSTKIYVAYKLRQAQDMWPIVRDIRRKGQANVRKVLAGIYESVRAEVDPKSKEYAEALENYRDDWKARHTIAHRIINKRYHANVGKSERDPFDFDVSVVFREHEGSIYLIPYCDMLMQNVLDFLKEDRRLRDFAYWNNTDEPDNVSPRQWKERGKVWDAIDTAGWHDSLVIEVCSWNQYYLTIDPWIELMNAHTKAEKRAEKTR